MLQVPDVTGADVAFGKIDHLPKWEDIPEEFKKGRTQWNDLFRILFYEGGKGLNIKPREGVDANKALQAIRAIMVSFQPKHEHKDAGCAYLFSEWFTDWSIDGKSKT